MEEEIYCPICGNILKISEKVESNKDVWNFYCSECGNSGIIDINKK